MSLVLGVDSSTQSTKVEVRDAASGELVARGRAAHPPTTPPKSEQPPEAWWQALREAVTDAGVDEVGAIAIAGQQHGMVTLDERGDVIRPAKLWNDTESAPDAAWLIDQLGGPDRWAEACGSVPVAAFTITKLSWLHRCEPEAWRRLHEVLLPHDYLNFRLTGARFTDRGDASGTGYWSPSRNDYRWDLLGIVDSNRDWSAAVPEVLGATDVGGTLTDDAMQHLGLRGRAPVVSAGTGDNMAAALGVALAPGDIVVSIGTSGTVYAVSDRPTGDPTGAVAGFADATGHYLPLVCTLNATQVTDAVARLLGVDHERLNEIALATRTGGSDLVLVPYFAGERTPNRPDATGTLTGLRTDVTPGHLARAAFEGVVCGLLDALDALTNAGVPTGGGRLLLVGGGARSPGYRQTLADLSGRPVVVPRGDEHVATGACVQASAAIGGGKPLEIAAAWGLGDGVTIEPDPAVPRAEVRERFAAAQPL